MISKVPASVVVTCKLTELASCATAILAAMPPTRLYCTKLKEQKPCLCKYLKDPTLQKYINTGTAKKVSRACNTPFPSVRGIQFPFSNISSPPDCGIYNIACSNTIPIIKFVEDGRLYVVKSIAYESNLLAIQYNDLVRANTTQICSNLQNFTVPRSPFLTFKSISPNYTFFKCKQSDVFTPPKNCTLYNYTQCKDCVLHYTKNRNLPAIEHNCSVFVIPMSEWIADPYGLHDLIPLLSAGFGLQWNLTHECEECFMNRGGFCNQNKTTGQFICSVDRRWIDDTYCPLPFISLTFNYPVFHIGESSLTLLFFYNCTQELVPQYQPIPCNSNETHHFFARLNFTGSLMNSSNLPKKCESYVSVPVMMDSKPQESCWSGYIGDFFSAGLHPVAAAAWKTEVSADI
ncbi:hypothetical protein MRB53_018528 [Persea americana]|uniref:Uncharacterized protein n=1 Tax=Persea americana TaxID=3435 RepID=A0ACC2M922_PERAE|nr:hypothetical protein MRB53_018528 [Persea americana]